MLSDKTDAWLGLGIGGTGLGTGVFAAIADSRTDLDNVHKSASETNARALRLSSVAQQRNKKKQSCVHTTECTGIGRRRMDLNGEFMDVVERRICIVFY